MSARRYTKRKKGANAPATAEDSPFRGDFNALLNDGGESGARVVVHSKEARPTTGRCEVSKHRRHYASILAEDPKATPAAASVATLVGLGLLGAAFVFLNPWSRFSLCNAEIDPFTFLLMFSGPTALSAVFLSLATYRAAKGAIVYQGQKTRAERQSFSSKPTNNFALATHEEAVAFFNTLCELIGVVLPWGNFTAAACTHILHMLGLVSDLASYTLYALTVAFVFLIQAISLARIWPHSAYNVGVEQFKLNQHMPAERQKQIEETKPRVYAFSPWAIAIVLLSQSIQVALSYIPTDSSLAEKYVLLLRVAALMLSITLVPMLSAVVIGLSHCGDRKPQTCQGVVSIILHLMTNLHAVSGLFGFFNLWQVVKLHPHWGQTQAIADTSFFVNPMGNETVCSTWRAPAEITNSSTSAALTTAATAGATTATAETHLSVEEMATIVAEYLAVATVLTLGFYAKWRLYAGYGDRQPETRRSTRSVRSVSSFAVEAKESGQNVGDEGNDSEDDYMRLGPQD